jgi:hypothetical protein
MIPSVLDTLSNENFLNLNHIYRLQDIIIRKSETDIIDLKNALKILNTSKKLINVYEIGVLMRILDMIYI